MGDLAPYQPAGVELSNVVLRYSFPEKMHACMHLIDPLSMEMELNKQDFSLREH